MSLNDINSLSHTKWNCKYHIVFAPKYRRKIFYKEKREEAGKILRKLCEWKRVEILAAEVCPDHVHMLVEIPPKIAVSSFMGYLKGKSSTMLYEQFGELKYKYRSREFWCRGYYADTARKNTSRIAEYIKNRLRKATKAKSVFPADDSLLKMLYLAMMDITKKWTGRRQDWGAIHSQPEIFLVDRIPG